MTENTISKEEKDEATKKQEDWLQKKWRPMMAMMYMIVCFFDFVVFPIMFTVVQFWETSAANDAFRQWQPLTLVGAGLFHMAMGAVLGITAWGRTQEKVAGAATNASPAPALPGPAGGAFRTYRLTLVQHLFQRQHHLHQRHHQHLHHKLPLVEVSVHQDHQHHMSKDNQSTLIMCLSVVN